MVPRAPPRIRGSVAVFYRRLFPPSHRADFISFDRSHPALLRPLPVRFGDPVSSPKNIRVPCLPPSSWILLALTVALFRTPPRQSNDEFAVPFSPCASPPHPPTPFSSLLRSHPSSTCYPTLISLLRRYGYQRPHQSQRQRSARMSLVTPLVSHDAFLAHPPPFFLPQWQTF